MIALPEGKYNVEVGYSDPANDVATNQCSVGAVTISVGTVAAGETASTHINVEIESDVLYVSGFAGSGCDSFSWIIVRSGWVESGYELGVPNSNECYGHQTRISSFDECAAAAQAFGLIFDTNPVQNSFQPRGCISAYGNEGFWNIDPVGGAMNGQTPICERTHTLLIRQTITTGVWPTDVLELNPEDPENDNYAILNQLDQFRSNDGRFYFKLTWPDADEEVIYEWSQTSNPLLEDVVGYEPIHVPYTGRGWGGLEPSSKGLMDGSVLGNFKGNWFYAVGAYDTVSTGLLPASAKADNDNGYWQTRVELYVQKKQVCSVGEELLEGACAPCIPGTYNANVGGVCTLCPVGTYASDVGSVTCTPCEIGFNGPYVGLQSCMACPQGYTTVGYGQTECIAEATNEPTMQPTSTNEPTMQPTSTNAPTMQPTSESWEIIYYQTKTTCLNGGQKISQPCNGGRGTGCSYDACMQHCFDEMECNFFFYITSRSGCILYDSCDLTRTPAYSGTTVQITRN